ncbi:MAG: helix-turn-helix domain-containing protein [bacterium]|nr:helix-turn-helix domain-containing protein [bacterium]
MNIKPIKTEADHEAALAEIDSLWQAPSGSPESDRLEILATLVEAYEEKNHPIEPPDPVDAIIFRMDQLGMSRRDLEAYIGPKGRVSEILNRARSLTLPMIRRLHEGLGIPADVLIRESCAF